MSWASTFCAIKRICSRSSFLPVYLASAAVVAIINADEPEMPAPAGDSEWVSTSKPPSGAKKRDRCPASGCLNLRAEQSSPKLRNRSEEHTSELQSHSFISY